MNEMPKAYEGNEPYIFISYAHKDSEKVIPAIKGMQDAGYPVWYDAGIQVGSEWPDYIAEHLLGSSLVIAFISEHSIASDNCRQEIVYALDKHKHVLTVRLDEAKLKPGMEMQLNLCQSLLAFKHSTVESYVDELIRAPFISQCLSMEQPDIPKREADPAHEHAMNGGQKKPSSDVTASFEAISQKVGTAFNNFNNTKDSTSEHDEKDIEDNKLFAILSYLNILVLVPLLMAKESKYARFHANQGLALLISFVVLFACSFVLKFMTAGILGFVSVIISLIYVVYIIIGVVNAATGKAKELPLIGNFKILK